MTKIRTILTKLIDRELSLSDAEKELERLQLLAIKDGVPDDEAIYNDGYQDGINDAFQKMYLDEMYLDGKR